MYKNRTFQSKVARWLKGSRSIRIGVSGNFRPNIYIALTDSSGERYTIHSPEDAREMGIALIESAAEAERRVAEAKTEAKKVA